MCLPCSDKFLRRGRGRGFRAIGQWESDAMGADSIARSPITESTLAGGPIADPAAPARVDVGCGEHAQQGGAASCAIGTNPPAHASDRARPLESLMQRCGFLGLRFTHRTKLPRVETRPGKEVRAPHSLGPVETPIPPAEAVLANQSGRDFGASDDSPPRRSSGRDILVIPAAARASNHHVFSRWVRIKAMSIPIGFARRRVHARTRFYLIGRFPVRHSPQGPRNKFKASLLRNARVRSFGKPTRRSHRASRTTPKL